MMLVVGERENSDRVCGKLWTWRLALRRRAFRDARSQAKLASLGLGGVQAINLLPPDGRNARWEPEAARRRALEWLEEATAGSTLYLAGRRVEAAFGLRRVSWGTIREVGGRMLVVVPHPSGLNHFWNDTGDVSRLRRRLSKLPKEINDDHQESEEREPLSLPAEGAERAGRLRGEVPLARAVRGVRRGHVRVRAD